MGHKWGDTYDLRCASPNQELYTLYPVQEGSRQLDRREV